MRMQRSFAVLAGAVAVVLPIGIALTILLTAVDIPFGREWMWSDLIYTSHIGALRPADVWAPHDGHRMVFPQIAMLALDELGGWSQRREQMLSLVFLVCSEIALIGMIRRSVRGIAGSVAILMSALFLFGVWQSENLSWGFQLGWFLCNAATIGTIALLTRVDRRAREVVLAALLAVVASGSLSHGIFAWASGTAAIVLVPRKRSRTLVVWLAAAVATYAVYRIGSAHATNAPLSLVQHPIHAGFYALAYLGSPLEGFHGPRRSAAAGAVALLVVAVSFVCDVRRSNTARHVIRRAPWYALALYPVLCAVGTALVHVQDGAQQALSSRYTTVAGLLWVAAIVIAATYVARLPLPSLRTRAFAASMALIVVVAVRAEYAGWLSWQAANARNVAARAAFEHSDASFLTTMSPDPDAEKRRIGELKRIHDGIFGGG